MRWAIAEFFSLRLGSRALLCALPTKNRKLAGRPAQTEAPRKAEFSFLRHCFLRKRHNLI